MKSMNFMMATRGFLILSSFLLPVFGFAGEKTPEFTTLSGKKIAPLSHADDTVAVVIFITVDCPVANAYAPEINRLHQAFADKPVRITLVHVDPDLSAEDAKKHASDYRLEAPVIIDRKHRLVAITEARYTPEAAVYDAKGERVYLGRINNLYSGFGDRRRVVTEHNLRDAITAALAGKPVTKPKVEPVGCYIPDLD
ncbi:MAG: redoxin domain-containing protein [Verrucomicrobiales bacterium]|nr:redoxin domain-containing protein [Verrucomicrobiales bacterium]